MVRPPPRSTRTDTLFPYTTLFRSQAIITYKPDDNITRFAKAVRGAKAGGVDYQFGAGATNPRGAIFKPEKALSYEAGVKALLLDRKLSVDLTAFRTDLTDLQVKIGRAACRERVCQYG